MPIAAPAALAVSAAALIGASLPAPLVSVSVTGLRSGKGTVMACLTGDPHTFPDCQRDPAAHRLIVPADAGGVVLDFGAVVPGSYALSLFHDENGNGRLDTVMLMPREGFGFSRDAKVRFGPPKFTAAAFAVEGAAQRQTVRMRYMF
ncbi:MAG: DUF2141 domain-containing protein [Pseudomonadota bacterium]